MHYRIALHSIELYCIGLLLFELSLPPRSEHQFTLIAADLTVLNTSMLMTHLTKVHQLRMIGRGNERGREGQRDRGAGHTEGWREVGRGMIISCGGYTSFILVTMSVLLSTLDLAQIGR